MHQLRTKSVRFSESGCRLLLCAVLVWAGLVKERLRSTINWDSKDAMFSNALKSTFAWIGLLSIVPTSLFALQRTGYEQSISAIGVVVLCLLVWHWRRLLNYIQKLETVHSVHLYNNDGDANYTRETAVLPWIAPVRQTEVLVSLSSETGWIENVSTDDPVSWTEKQNKLWHGHVQVSRHRSRLFAFGRPAGIRVKVASIWRRAFVRPSHDFVVACPERGASRIVIRVRWNQDVRPLECFAQYTRYPTNLVRKEHMIDTSKLPWQNESDVVGELQQDGSLLMNYVIDKPLHCSMYRIFWRMPSNKAVKFTQG